MKITKTQLKKIISEEIKRVIEEQGSKCKKCGHLPFTHGKGGGPCNTKGCDCDGYEA